MVPQSKSAADIEICAENGDWIENRFLTEFTDAAGMSKKQLRSMVKAETLIYSCLGCAIGLIIGLLFSK